MGDIKEMEYKMKTLCESKDTMLGWIKNEIAKGFDWSNADILRVLTDCVKDLASAEKDCYESEYYKSVTKAMDEYEDYIKENDSMKGPSNAFISGYNHRHLANGQFAAAGKGIKMGYQPEWGNVNIKADMYDPTQTHPVRMGYDNRPEHSRHGEKYDMYHEARRHYTESHDMKHKEEADQRGMEYVRDGLSTFFEIFEDADPTLKRQLRSEILAAAENMKL